MQCSDNNNKRKQTKSNDDDDDMFDLRQSSRCRLIRKVLNDDLRSNLLMWDESLSNIIAIYSIEPPMPFLDGYYVSSRLWEGLRLTDLIKFSPLDEDKFMGLVFTTIGGARVGSVSRIICDDKEEQKTQDLSDIQVCLSQITKKPNGSPPLFQFSNFNKHKYSMNVQFFTHVDALDDEYPDKFPILEQCMLLADEPVRWILSEMNYGKISHDGKQLLLNYSSPDMMPQDEADLFTFVHDEKV